MPLCKSFPASSKPSSPPEITCPVLKHHISDNLNIPCPNQVPYLCFPGVTKFVKYDFSHATFFQKHNFPTIKAHLLTYHKIVQHIILSLIHKMWGHNRHVKSQSNCLPPTRIHRLVCKLIGTTWVFVFCGFLQNIEKWVSLLETMWDLECGLQQTKSVSAGSVHLQSSLCPFSSRVWQVNITLFSHFMLNCC